MLLAFIPFSGIVPLCRGIAERYTYLASAGFAIALVSVIFSAPRQCLGVGLGVLALWAGWGGWRTHSRVSDWSDELTLYTSTLKATPNSHVLAYNLGVKYGEAKDSQRAEEYYRRSLRLYPGYFAAKVNLANLLQKQARDAEARRLHREVLAADPRRADAWLNLGNLYLRTGSVE